MANIVNRNNTNGNKQVTISAGSNKPITVDWKDDDTVATVLVRAGVQMSSGQTATLGRRRVKDPAKTKVNPGETIVVAGKPANG